MNLTHTAVLTVAFVLRLKPQGEGVMQILFPKLKLGAKYFMSPVFIRFLISEIMLYRFVNIFLHFSNLKKLAYLQILNVKI